MFEKMMLEYSSNFGIQSNDPFYIPTPHIRENIFFSKNRNTDIRVSSIQSCELELESADTGCTYRFLIHDNDTMTLTHSTDNNVQEGVRYIFVPFQHTDGYTIFQSANPNDRLFFAMTTKTAKLIYHTQHSTYMFRLK